MGSQGSRVHSARVCDTAHPFRAQQCRVRGGLQGTEAEQQGESQDSKEWAPAGIPGGDMKDSRPCEALWPGQTSSPWTQCLGCPCNLSRVVDGGWGQVAREYSSGLKDFLSGS